MLIVRRPLVFSAPPPISMAAPGSRVDSMRGSGGVARYGACLPGNDLNDLRKRLEENRRKMVVEWDFMGFTLW